jgi:hypothetical protein
MCYRSAASYAFDDDGYILARLSGLLIRTKLHCLDDIRNYNSPEARSLSTKDETVGLNRAV